MALAPRREIRHRLLQQNQGYGRYAYREVLPRLCHYAVNEAEIPERSRQQRLRSVSLFGTFRCLVAFRVTLYVLRNLAFFG